MSIDTHLDATPSDITASATEIGNIKTHVDSAETDLISARKTMASMDGATAINAAISISQSADKCKDMVSTLGSYKTALDNLASALGKVKTDLEGIRSRATEGGLTLSGETILQPTSSYPFGPDLNNSYEVYESSIEQEKITLYNTLETDTSDIRDRETEVRQAFADACKKITDGGPVAQAVKSTVGGYFVPSVNNGDWRDPVNAAKWAVGRAGNIKTVMEAGGLRATGATFKRATDGAGWAGKIKDGFHNTVGRGQLKNWKVPDAAKGSTGAKAVSAARGAAGTALKWGGRASTVATFAVDAYGQWKKDSHNPSIGEGEKVVRATTKGVGSAAGGWAGAAVGGKAGAAIGACVGGPVGAAVGGIVGGVVGGAIGSGLGKSLADGANGLLHKWLH